MSQRWLAHHLPPWSGSPTDGYWDSFTSASLGVAFGLSLRGAEERTRPTLGPTMTLGRRGSVRTSRCCGARTG